MMGQNLRLMGPHMLVYDMFSINHLPSGYLT